MNTCRQCQAPFQITEADREFYKKVSPLIGQHRYAIPEPTLCPECRMREKFVWRSELHLFQRKSDFSGNMVLSQLPAQADYKVYSEEEWWSDAWNPMDYRQEFDFNRPFFEQFDWLMKKVPLIARSVHQNENCDFVNCTGWSKNCYLIASANYNEDCYYGNYLNDSKNCVDCSFVKKSQLCYECVDCIGCYNLKYSQNCNNCSDSAFLYNCRNCHDCFGSVNLVNRQYVFMNQQLSKEEYEQRIAHLNLQQRSRVEEAKAFFEKHQLQYPRRHSAGEMNENVSGNNLSECKNSQYCFDASDLEDCRYCIWLGQAKNCMDIYAFGLSAEQSYNSSEIGADSQRVLFSALVMNSSDVFYSYNIRQCENVFGCAGLRHKQYCILNKQYTKEEYEELVPKIILHMREAGEWGEFFPMNLSPMAYNQTIAQDYFPLSQKEATELGAKWNQEPEPGAPMNKVELPDSIEETESSICDQVLTCEKTGRPYRLIPQELEFYRKNNIPLPSVCFQARHQERLAKRNPRKLWNRACDQCGGEIETTYSPERLEIVYCEECYLKEIY